MSSNQGQKQEIDRYVVIHVATTCDEHGVYVTKDSAEVIEIGWLLLDSKNCEEVWWLGVRQRGERLTCYYRFIARASLSNPSTPRSHRCAVSPLLLQRYGQFFSALLSAY